MMKPLLLSGLLGNHLYAEKWHPRYIKVIFVPPQFITCHHQLAVVYPIYCNYVLALAVQKCCVYC